MRLRSAAALTHPDALQETVTILRQNRADSSSAAPPSSCACVARGLGALHVPLARRICGRTRALLSLLVMVGDAASTRAPFVTLPEGGHSCSGGVRQTAKALQGRRCGLCADARGLALCAQRVQRACCMWAAGARAPTRRARVHRCDGVLGARRRQVRRHVVQRASGESRCAGGRAVQLPLRSQAVLPQRPPPRP
eukprot:2471326-Pleurochrysis_carterae.AAC.1